MAGTQSPSRRHLPSTARSTSTTFSGKLAFPDEPTSDEPTSDKPTSDEPTSDEPTSDEPTSDEHTSDEPTSNEPTSNEPTSSSSIRTTHTSTIKREEKERPRHSDSG